LAKALNGQKLPADVAKLALRHISGGHRGSPALEKALTQAGSLQAVQRVLTPAEMEAFVLDVQKHGNAARGESIFRRKELACLKCHAVAGAGGQVGPDLISIGASAPVDYLVESLLQPNKAVKENYHSTVVATNRGQIVTGIKVRETKDELVLRNVEDQEVTIPVKDIEEKSAGVSLMPEGSVDGLIRSELVDLVRFLSELGKVGPYAVSTARVVRRWQVLDATSEAYTLLSRTHLAMVADPQAKLSWSPAYSQVNGTLPLDAFPRFHWQSRPGTFGFVRCQVDVSTAGKVLLRLNSPASLTLWNDGMPIDPQKEMVLDLQPGTRTLTFQIDLEQRKESLRCELDDVPQSPARVRIVGGK
jgi:putative heme-binding domain-containing protein